MRHIVRLWIGLFVLIILGIAVPSEGWAQFDRLRQAAGELGDQLPDARSLYDKPPITTSLADATFGDPALDGRLPETDWVMKDDADGDESDLDVENAATGESSEIPIGNGYAGLERTDHGGFVLQPGFWEFHNQSYCLKAGTHGPGGGDGYLYAPPAGPAEVAVMAIVRRSVDHPEIHQHDIQLLLWALIARTKFEDLEPNLKMVAAQFLEPEMLAALNRSALDILPDAVMREILDEVPDEVRAIVEAEARLRHELTEPGGSFDDIEQIAVLTGLAPAGPGSRDVPLGRWSRHPDGFYVRYLPNGYSYTVVQVWVPEGSPAIGKEYDPANHIAVPGNTARQRLIQSGRAHAD